MKKIFQLLLLISITACFTSCDDVNNNPDPSEAYDVAPEMKIYFDSFKKGSWWVLTSDITNRKDSIVVDWLKDTSIKVLRKDRLGFIVFN